MEIAVVFKLLLAAGGVLIAYQDVKSRLISLWLILLYSTTCCGYSWYTYGTAGLLGNLISMLLYGALCFCVVKLYYFMKEKKLSSVIDTKLGLADVILASAIGITFDLPGQVFFFMITFTATALLWLSVFRKSTSIPLAAFLVAFHVVMLSLDLSLPL